MRRRATGQSWLRSAIFGGGIFAVFAWIGRRSGAAPPARPAGASSISDRGTRLIALFEGFDPELINDDAGHCTIGYGHLVHLGPCDGSEPAEFQRGITRERGLELRAQEIAAVAEVVSRLVVVPLSQPQLDALVSLAFNVGQTRFATSTLLRLLNQGDYASVPAQIGRFVFAGGRRLPGLVARRAAEGRLFATGDYGPVA